MLVGEAREAAADWIAADTARLATFRGAFHTGSTLDLADDVELPSTSDVDIVVVLAGDEPPPKPGKLRHRGALLEITHLPWTEVADAEQVADCYFLAPSFAGDHTIADPTGHLAALRERIEPTYRLPAPITRRCADVRRRVEARLAALPATGEWPDQVGAWLFPTSLPTQIPLVAALRLPTVRRRYRAARDVLHGHEDLYESLLRTLGCHDCDRSTMQHHLDRLADLFDRAAAVARTRFPFSADITPAARPVAIDGSQQLIDAGDHREAVFWILATHVRCQQILAVDGPADRRSAADFRAAAADLAGLHGPDDIAARRAQTLDLLPTVTAVAGSLIPAGWPPPP